MIKIDIKEITDLIYTIDKSNLSKFQLCTEKLNIKIKKNQCDNNITNKLDNEIFFTSKNNISIEQPEIKAIKSSLVGVFYNYYPTKINNKLMIGSKIKKGELLGIIMYLNVPIDIVSDIDGIVIDIGAKNGQIVEYGQLLYKISINF
ncbi:acetyl-CoA carboxylase biotin carboxyl carrier protein [Clostridium butyricum]